MGGYEPTRSRLETKSQWACTSPRAFFSLPTSSPEPTTKAAHSSNFQLSQIPSEQAKMATAALALPVAGKRASRSTSKIYRKGGQTIVLKKWQISIPSACYSKLWRDSFHASACAHSNVCTSARSVCVTHIHRHARMCAESPSSALRTANHHWPHPRTSGKKDTP